MSSYTGKIIVLAFPETFVKFSDESILHFFSVLGFGKKQVIKAGHAAMVLIENKTGKADYYDFGRYITPKGMGRVRSVVTDVELEIPFKAEIGTDNSLQNVEQFLCWLEAHPEKTHGGGKLVASVCEVIHYQKAKDFVTKMQSQGSMLYRAFGNKGSNCSRLVTDALLVSTDENRIKKPLKRNNFFSPSPLGNVVKAAFGNPVYEVKNGKVKEYKPSNLLWTVARDLMDTNIPEALSDTSTTEPNTVKKAHLLSGVGSSAYFTIADKMKDELYQITRYDQYGEKDFCGWFQAAITSFDIQQPYRFVYDSNCSYCHVEQNGKKIRFDLIEKAL